MADSLKSAGKEMRYFWSFRISEHCGEDSHCLREYPVSFIRGVWRNNSNEPIIYFKQLNYIELLNNFLKLNIVNFQTWFIIFFYTSSKNTKTMDVIGQTSRGITQDIVIMLTTPYFRFWYNKHSCLHFSKVDSRSTGCWLNLV